MEAESLPPAPPPLPVPAPPTSHPFPTEPLPNNQTSNATSPSQGGSAQEGPFRLSTTSISSWAKSIRIPQLSSQGDSETSNEPKSPLSRIASGFGLRTSPKSSQAEEVDEGSSSEAQSSVFGSFTRGLVDSSKNAVKAVQTKARHIVSQNKRRYQEGGFDLDMTYITENIIAMGFPAGDISSGIFGYVEGFYRNHMEEVIKFFETHHKGKYKVYNLCAERLYDASLFEGKVASFPFDDHNCPPVQLITSFCQSAYSWLKEDIENVVVVHCKAGMARTGLMISSLLLFLKFFPTAEESISYYNQKRCLDGKALVLPSQIRYVKYFERILTYFNGENQPGRRCILRGFRLHKCPYWIRPSITVSDHNGVLFSTKKHPRTKDMTPDDFWFSAPRKGIMVFALPGERGLAELAGDFKVHFHERQGDFYFWLNTTMMENRKTLTGSDMDGWDKRKLPSPGFQIEVVLMDYDAVLPTEKNEKAADAPVRNTPDGSVPTAIISSTPVQTQVSKDAEKDEVFSDSESEEGGPATTRRIGTISEGMTSVSTEESGPDLHNKEKIESVTEGLRNVSVNSAVASSVPVSETKPDAKSEDAAKTESTGISDFKAMAADASVFTFGDEEDYESE